MNLVAFCAWLLSLRIISLRFTHVVAGNLMSFLFKAEYCSMAWIDCIMFIHSSLRALGVFSAFWLLQIMLL